MNPRLLYDDVADIVSAASVEILPPGREFHD